MNEYEIPETNKHNLILSIAGLILALVLVGFVYYSTKVNKAASSESREVQFTIEKGLSTKQIAHELGEAKIISQPWVFEIYARLHGAGGKIQAGTYMLNAKMAIPEIVDVVTHGRVIESARTITIIEGWTNDQIGKYLIERAIIDNIQSWDNALLHAPFESLIINERADQVGYQGFLFPDTYKIAKDETASNIVGEMLSNFQEKVGEKTIDDLGDRLLEVMTLASIIEKEVGRNKSSLTDEDLKVMQTEREKVAAVFYNRLKIGMGLESDATVNYITGKSDRSVTIADTKIKSPYNTYRVRGLPPGPISNPGIGAIWAAIHPAVSDDLYFLNAPDGTAYFAKTLAEHNANRAKYLR